MNETRPVDHGRGVDSTQDDNVNVATLSTRLMTAWATLAAYALVTTPVTFALRFFGVSDPVGAGVISVLLLTVSVYTYWRRGADFGKLTIGLRSATLASREPINLGQAVVRSAHLPLIGLASVVDALAGFDGAVMSTVGFALIAANITSIVVTDYNQSITELLAGSVTLEGDLD